jgi:hypothetical protein
MENEIKMAAEPNCQIKYRDAHDRKLVIEKFRFLCELLGMKIDPMEDHNINDDYWDDDKASFYNKKMVVRTRKEDNDFYYTLKIPRSEFSLGLLRNEYEKKIESSTFPFTSIDECKALLKEKLGLDAHFISSDLHKSLTVKNSRTSFNVKTKTGKIYLVCFDCFHFIKDSSGFKRYSDNYYEIEIENKNEDLSFDDDIISLIGAINRLFNFFQHKDTKYGRGYLWANSKEPLESYIFYMIDIVSYSTAASAVQKQVVKKLNYFTKEYLEHNNLSLDVNYYYNSTGDGYILIIQKEYINKIVPFFSYIYSKLRKFNESIGDEMSFGVRCGLNYGPAFMYSDMKENINFAGDGINMVTRVTNLGNAGHILASSSFYEYMHGCGCDISSFIFAGNYKVKHDVAVSVYKYCFNDGMIGNPDDINLITKDT